MFDDGGVVIENLRGVRFRAPGAWHAFYGEQVLCGVGNSVKRAAIVAVVNFFFGGFWVRPRAFLGEGGERVFVAGGPFASGGQKIVQALTGKLLGFWSGFQCA